LSSCLGDTKERGEEGHERGRVALIAATETSSLVPPPRLASKRPPATAVERCEVNGYGKGKTAISRIFAECEMKQFSF
jgi:hypothetical protein